MNPLESQLSHGESKDLVFVPSAEDFDRIASHLVALLNSGGGTILVGVDKKGEVLGVPAARSVTEKLATYLREQISPKALFSLGSDETHGKKIITSEVPGGRDTPFVRAGSVFLRKGKETV